jgi:Fic family protein
MVKEKEIDALISEFNRLSKGLINFEKLALYTSTFHSTKIEGCTLTEKQVVDLLEDSKTAGTKSHEDHLMVFDYFTALKSIVEAAHEKKRFSLSFIKSLGGLVLKNTGGKVSSMSGDFDSSKGDFRKVNVYAGSRRFPDFSKVESMCRSFCETANKKMATAKTNREKLEVAFYVHFQLVTIHPFSDGNGRVSRIVMTYIFLYFGLPVGFVFSKDRLKYIEALEASRKTESMDPFYKFMFAQYSKSLKSEIKILKG